MPYKVPLLQKFTMMRALCTYTLSGKLYHKKPKQLAEKKKNFCGENFSMLIQSVLNPMIRLVKCEKKL